jgi:hypothetical protein
MLKKAVQQGRRASDSGTGTVEDDGASPHGASERTENAAGGLFQHPAAGLLIYSTVKENAWKHGDAYSLTAL